MANYLEIHANILGPFQNSELLTLTYGALVTQIIRDFENIDDVNKQLERIGYNMGVRLIEDFLSRTASTRCVDMRETADKIQQAFRMYLNVQPTISNWTASADEFSLIFDTNPLTEFVELPADMSALRYSGILCGCIRGALEMVQLEVQCWFAQVSDTHQIAISITEKNNAFDFMFFKDQLKGDGTTEIRVKFIRRLEDAIPAGED